MKKLIIFTGFLMLLAGCSEEDVLLRKAEKQLKNYLDYPGSYRRIEWRITDTLSQNDILRDQLKEPLSIQAEKLDALSGNMPVVQKNIKSVKEIINTNALNKATPVSWIEKQKAAEMELSQQRLQAELEVFLKDSTDLANELTKIQFRKDSIEARIKSLEKGSGNSEIKEIRMEIRFRAKMSDNQYGTFCSKMMFANNEVGILDTFYDGIKLQ